LIKEKTPLDLRILSANLVSRRARQRLEHEILRCKYEELRIPRECCVSGRDGASHLEKRPENLENWTL